MSMHAPGDPVAAGPAGIAAARPAPPRMLNGILTVGGWTLASRVLGLAREMLIAAILGAGMEADAFFVALKLPNLFRRLFGEGAFNAAFIPAFSGMLAAEGHEAARDFAQQALGVMTFWLLFLTIAGEIAMPGLMTVLAPGFEKIPVKFALTVHLTRITFPYLLMICLTALLSGVLNGLDRFAAAAAAPVLFNVLSIASLLLLRPFVPTPAEALAWGVSLSGVAQLVLLLWATHRAGMTLRLPRPRMTPQMRLLLRRMAPGLVGAGVTQLNLSIDVIIASLLPPGSVALLNYADRVNQLPLGAIGAAVGTALLPMLSRQVRSGDADAATATMNRALEYALLLTLPAALALAVTPVPIVSVLFGRGAFTEAAVHGSAAALSAYAVGLPAFVMVKVLAPGFFARGDTGTPVRIGLCTVALNLCLNLLFMHPLQQVGPALATSLAAIVNVAVLAIVLVRRGHFALDRQLRGRVPRIAAAAIAMAAVLLAAERFLYAPLAGMGLRTPALALLVGLGVLAYFAVGQVVGGFDLREFRATLLRRRRPG